jgi:hypothetical protein
LPESSTERYALLMDAQIKLSKEECAGGMVQRSNDVTSKDAQIQLSREECVRGMEQMSDDAAVMNAQI